MFVGLFFMYRSEFSRNLLLVGNVIMGVGIASVYGTYFAFVDQYVTLDDLIGTVMIFFNGLMKVSRQISAKSTKPLDN